MAPKKKAEEEKGPAKPVAKKKAPAKPEADQVFAKPKAAPKKAAPKDPLADLHVYEEPPFESLDELPNDFSPYRLSLRFRFKLADQEMVFEGQHVKPGDYIGFASDGGRLHLTEEELLRYYETGL